MGFKRVEVVDRYPFQLEDAARYPLFTPDLIASMRRLLSPKRQAEVATSIIVKAEKPS